jgi:hypothetical protein
MIILVIINWNIIISAFIVILGWGIGYYFTNKHNLHNKRRDVITNYLIEAYRDIENACHRKDTLTEEHKRKMERAIADIQLFGSLKQVATAKEFTEVMNKNSYGDPRALLAELRNDLREELRLELASKNPEDIIHWRIK